MPKPQVNAPALCALQWALSLDGAHLVSVELCWGGLFSQTTAPTPPSGSRNSLMWSLGVHKQSWRWHPTRTHGACPVSVGLPTHSREPAAQICQTNPYQSSLPSKVGTLARGGSAAGFCGVGLARLGSLHLCPHPLGPSGPRCLMASSTGPVRGPSSLRSVGYW